MFKTQRRLKIGKKRFSQSSNISTLDEGRNCLIFVILIKKSIDNYLIISISLHGK